MVRRIPTQVHQQASRLLKGSFIRKPPQWYDPVLENPPIPLPARAPPRRTTFDAPTVKRTVAPRKTPGPRPLPVMYLEDEVRRQFFRDHPFETFRPVTLVEGGAIEEENPIRGKDWTRLRQRGRNPSPEDAVRFAVSLHVHHDYPLTEAYASAVGQFRALRSEQHIATSFAAQEAEAYGAMFGPSAVQRGFANEERALEKNRQKQAEIDEKELTVRKRWRAIVDRGGHVHEWTKGEEYVRLWKQGVRPDYSPHLTEPILDVRQTVQEPPTVAASEEIAGERHVVSKDFMGIGR